MLRAQSFEKFLSGLCSSCLYVLAALLDGIHRFAIVLLLPRKVISQDIVKRRGGVLAVASRVYFQLRASGS